MFNKLEISFVTDLSRKMTISVPRADGAITAAQIKTAMERIIASNAINAKAGVPRTVDSAIMVKTTIDEHTM